MFVTFASVATALVIAMLLLGGLMLLKKKGVDITKVIKPCAVVLFIVSFLRYLYHEPAVYYVQGLSHPSSPFNVDTPNPALTGFSIILIWFSYAAMLLTVMSAF